MFNVVLIKKMKRLIFAIILFSSITCFAQDLPTDSFPDEDIVIWDDSWHDKGFDFMIAGGIYMGNKHNAAYYNGSPENENNLNFIFNNRYRYEEINRLVIANYPYISDSIFLGELPQNMNYSPSMAISFGARYKFNKHWAINLNYSFVKLRVSDMFTMTFDAELGNYRDPYIIAHLIGRENRSLFDLSASYLFHPHKIAKPFIEAGLQFNYVRVNKFFALIEDTEYELLDYYNGVDYIPNVDRFRENVIYGGAGFGVSMAAGVKLAFNKYISVDPTLYVSASSFGLERYKNIGLNYGFYIRIVMSDIVFMK